jgi:hypothetical protein
MATATPSPAAFSPTASHVVVELQLTASRKETDETLSAAPGVPFDTWTATPTPEELSPTASHSAEDTQ